MSRDNNWLKRFRVALTGQGPSDGEPIGVEGPKFVEAAIAAGLAVEALLVSDSGAEHLEPIFQTMASPSNASESLVRSDAKDESGTSLGPIILTSAPLTSTSAVLKTSQGMAGSSHQRTARSSGANGKLVAPLGPILRTSDRLFATAAGTKTSQGIAALCTQPGWEFDDLLQGINVRTTQLYQGTFPLVVVLAEIQDPGNVGTILRSAEAFGATGAVATRGSADPWSPKALRASAGSALRLPVLRGTGIPELLSRLKEAKIKIVAATIRGQDVSSALKSDILEPAAIFIGNEGAGLPPEVERAADAKVAIPMSASVESLNAAVAASLLLYEIARARKAN